MGKRATILFAKALPKEDKAVLRAFAATLVTQVLDGRAFTCLFTGDKQLHTLNFNFLGHDYPTDVLSFPEDDGAGSIGELAISIDRATEQAKRFGHATVEELQILMLHGVLHLTGLDHETDKGEMRRAETKWRKTFELRTGLIERSKQ